jgi:UDP-glucose 4-epimerase
MINFTKDSARIVLITGAAGFIGSQLTDVLLAQGCTARRHPAFELHRIDLAEEAAVLGELTTRLRGRPISEVWHLAANSDIPAGVRDPRVDYRNTFQTTFNTLLLMRELKIPRIAFASTSAVYGVHSGLLRETTGPLLPISNYGAMKLASEGLISAAVESYLEQAHIFRFPNVLGPRLTHGIIYDFLNKLKRDPSELEVLGDGTQQKPYLHVKNLIEAMLFIRENARDRVNLFNIGPEDEGATVAEIAKSVLAGVTSSAPIRYTGGARGWVGDVPRFCYSVEKLAQLGWRTSSTSLEVVRRTVAEALAPEEPA